MPAHTTLAALLLIGALPFSMRPGHCEELIPEEAAENFQRGVSLVKNFDVLWQCNWKDNLKRTTEEVDGKTVTRLSAFANGDTPRTGTFAGRHIWSQTGKFRSETFDPETGAVTNVRTSDGTSITSYDAQPRQAFISKATPSTQLSREGRHYTQFYSSNANSVPFATIFEHRKNLIRVKDASGLSGHYVLESPAHGSGDDRRVSWRLWLNPENEFLPTRIEESKQAGLWNRIDITQLKRLPEGVSVPLHAVVTQFDTSPNSPTFGQPATTFDYVIDAERSRWNFDDDDVFLPNLPAGTSVTDEISGLRYVK